MASELFWVKVTNPGYWQVAMDDICINNMPQNLCNSGTCQVMDGGRSYLPLSLVCVCVRV